jgi:hypothetical protein
MTIPPLRKQQAYSMVAGQTQQLLQTLNELQAIFDADYAADVAANKPGAKLFRIYTVAETTGLSNALARIQAKKDAITAAFAAVLDPDP